jgi:predicted P-loop ATPase
LAILGGPWYKDQIAGAIDTADGKKSISTTWLLELSELAAISGRRAEIEHIKAIISAQTDSYRSAYARREKHRPRRGTMWGSTNRTDWLRDETGNRRFLPVRCGEIDLVALRRDRDQILAEALALYGAGEPWHFVDPGVRAMAAEEQETRVMEDPWHRKIEEAVQGMAEVDVTQIACGTLCMELSKVDKTAQMRIAGVLTRLGFARKLLRREGKPVRRWVR